MGVRDQIPWHRLFHAYGAAGDAPVFLDALASDEIVEVDREFGWQFDGLPASFVWSGLYCGGRLTPATAPAARIIAARIGEPDFGAGDNTLRAAMLFFFREIARTVLAVETIDDLRHVAAERGSPAAQAWLDGFLAAPVPVFDWTATEDPGRPFLAGAMVDCYDLLPELFEPVTRLLHHESPVTRQVAAMTAATFVGHPVLADHRPEIVDYHVREAASTDDPYQRASLVIGIGELGVAPSRWLSDPHPGVRVCAALAPPLAADPHALTILLDAAHDPKAFDVVFGTMHMPQLPGNYSVALIETVCRRLPDFDRLVDVAIASLDIDGGSTVIDRRSTRLAGCAPYLAVGFAGGLPSPGAASAAQRTFARAVVAHDTLWTPQATTWQATLKVAGLPTEKEPWVAVATLPH